MDVVDLGKFLLLTHPEPVKVYRVGFLFTLVVL